MVASFTVLQLFSAYNFEKSSKNQLIHTLPYHTIYCCIVIQKWQYIDTSKLCIITPLLYTLWHLRLRIITTNFDTYVAFRFSVTIALLDRLHCYDTATDIYAQAYHCIATGTLMDKMVAMDLQHSYTTYKRKVENYFYEIILLNEILVKY